MTWDKSDTACVKTWIHLKILSQLNTTFRDAGNLRMNQLTFWNLFSSNDLRKIQIGLLSDQLDNMFRLHDKAKYEKGYSAGIAVERMSFIMSGADNNMLMLASEVNKCYRFPGEGINDK